MPEPVAVVGIGGDGPAGLTEMARSLIGRAEVLVGGRRHLAWFPDHPAERHLLAGGLAGVDAACAAWRAGRRTVVLASGDPGCFGVASALRQRLGRPSVRVLPAVSSVQLAFARAGLGWEDALLLSAHGRPGADVVRRVLCGCWTKLGLLLDEVNTAPCLAAHLRDAGLDDCRAVVGERLGAGDECVTETRLWALADCPADDFDPLSVLVLERESATPAGPRFGRPESDYSHAGGLITKAEVRAVGLSRLALGHADTVWDVGAGCGSVAVEAATFVPQGRVFAIERGDLSHLRENVRRVRAANVTIVGGEAPGCLSDLPHPDAVFLGGSGGRLDEILSHVAERLRPGGRLVAHFVRLDHLALLRARVAWPQEVVQLQVGRGQPAGGSLRFAALNPIFVVSAERPR